MGKRILSVVLALAACLSLLAVPVSAAETGGSCWDVIDMSGNGTGAFAVTANGDLYGWGCIPPYNWRSTGEPPRKLQSGVKNVASAASPNSNLADSRLMTTGNYFFVTDEGELFGVGANDFFQLGQGVRDREGHTDPLYIMDNVKKVVARGAMAAAITNDDKLYMWGCLRYADQNYVISEEPELMMSDVKDVSLSGDAMVALKKDGSVYSMGVAVSSEWPDESGWTEKRNYTSWYHRMDGCVDIAAAGVRACYALKADGTLYGWGQDDYMLCQEREVRYYDVPGDSGKLYVTKSYPNPVVVTTGVAEVDAWGMTGYFKKTDGSLWAAGSNYYGAMGQGGRNFDLQSDGEPYAHKAYKVADKVDKFCAGNEFCLYTTPDGRMWGFGLNNTYQLGHTRKDVHRSNLGDMGSASVCYPIISGLSVLPGSGPKPSTPAKPAAGTTATPTTSTVLVDGHPVVFDAYNIGGNNYFKLRDLGYALGGSAKQFEVSWDGAAKTIALTSGQPYTAVGGELSAQTGGAKTATVSTAKIQVDGRTLSLTAYNIGGNNYFKLRDIGEVFDFGVTWDGGSQRIMIDTSIGYTAG